MKIKVGISGDLLNEDNEPCFGNEALLKLENRDDIEISWMDKNIQEITPEDASKFDAILLNLPTASAQSVARKDCKLKIISRFGVGYDSVDISAMKEKNIIVTNTPNAVRRPVAVAALTMIFALSSRLLIKNDLVRSGKWNDRTNFMGKGLTKKTLGIIGAGSIGKETIKLSQPFFNNIIAFDPFLSKKQLYDNGALKVELIELAQKSDFIVILCNLNEETKGMIDKSFFSKMKQSAYIINLSRGPVINEKDLEMALKNKSILGAGLDVTTQEPLALDSQLMSYKNVILTPHSLCWTDECFYNIASEAIDSIINFFDKKLILNQVNR
ncbi:MAG: NAD(P)-dependent oxidoreductase [Proteobacteria bacterium]|nr:NAD(P)-dependent oxidoreductase [Pseudomonadota bacterium]MDA1136210.1 NAD(P)-dependent oxidoreductase [Pseudomonadota bacterium]